MRAGPSGHSMNKRVLLIAFHYPPMSRSSGVHRTRKFAQYLSEFGWDPLVLTIQPSAYEVSSDRSFVDSSGIVVKRAFGLDTAKHLSIGGRYFNFMAMPDRWISWWLGAVPAGMAMIRRHRPQIIFSTYPLATAHLIGLSLHKLSGLPWVADFRDPMTDGGYPTDPKRKRVYQWIEQKTVRRCAHAIFTTPDTRLMYSQRYPDIPANRWSVIANGYDEESFAEIEQKNPLRKADGNPRVLIHSGLLYRSERDPEPFFAALAELREAQHISAQNLKIILRASGEEKHYQQRLSDLGIADMVELAGSIPYREALQEMLTSDGLLLFQAANCNHQIPGKVYEYLRARRPVFALTDHAGNTASLLRESGIDTIADIANKDDIKLGLMKFLGLLMRGESPIASEAAIAAHSRYARTGELVKILNQVAEQHATT